MGELFLRFQNELFVLLVAALPIVELRGAIPMGYGLGLGMAECMVFAIIGNMLPVPVIILLGRKILQLLKRIRPLRKLAEKIELGAIRKSKKALKYSVIGLAIFVAIPLPATGAWTGALIACLFDIRLRYALPSIFLGVLVAAFIVAGLTYGIFGTVAGAF